MQPIDNSARHATYQIRPQASPDETDPEVLHDHIAELRAELARMTRRRLGLRMRTEISTLALRTEISWLNMDLAEAYIEQAGASGGHSSERAINQAPAFRPGPCDCGASARQVSHPS